MNETFQVKELSVIVAGQKYYVNNDTENKMHVQETNTFPYKSKVKVEYGELDVEPFYNTSYVFPLPDVVVDSASRYVVSNTSF